MLTLIRHSLPSPSSLTPVATVGQHPPGEINALPFSFASPLIPCLRFALRILIVIGVCLWHVGLDECRSGVELMSVVAVVVAGRDFQVCALRGEWWLDR